MVVVVPAFAIGYEGNPPAVTRLIIRLKGFVAELVRRTVNKPGAVEHCDDAHEDSPDHKRPAAKGKQQQTEGNLHENEVLLTNVVERVVVDILRHTGDIFIRRHFLEEPADVAPPEAFVRIMGIEMGIRVLMVLTVQADPTDRARLTTQRAAEYQEVFQPFRHLETSVADEAVPAEGDADSTGNPVKKDSDTYRCPAKVLG